MTSTPEWHNKALCVGHLDEMYASRRTQQERAIAKYCLLCTVKKECLAQEEADTQGETLQIWGVRGGLTPAVRRIRASGKTVRSLARRKVGNPT